MYTPASPKINKSSAEFHRKSYRYFCDYMDKSKNGSMMLLLREKNIPDATARRRAGLDIVDVITIGTDPEDPQTLYLYSRNKGERTITLDHTYMYWAQLVMMSQFIEEEYGIIIPKLSYPKKENGLLSCVELDGAHMAKLPDRYITWTFRLKNRGKHRCPEETSQNPANTVASTGEYGGIVCPYCIAEELNLNL